MESPFSKFEARIDVRMISLSVTSEDELVDLKDDENSVFHVIDQFL